MYRRFESYHPSHLLFFSLVTDTWAALAQNCPRKCLGKGVAGAMSFAWGGGLLTREQIEVHAVRPVPPIIPLVLPAIPLGQMRGVDAGAVMAAVPDDDAVR